MGSWFARETREAGRQGIPRPRGTKSTVAFIALASLLLTALVALGWTDGMPRPANRSVVRPAATTAGVYTNLPGGLPMSTTVLRIKAQQPASLDALRARASFQVLEPTWVPQGMELTRIHYYVLPGKERNPRGADWAEIFYAADDGRKLVVRQGNTSLPHVDASTPADAHGAMQVQGREAVWVDGFATAAVDRNDQVTLGPWKRGVLSLGWAVGKGPDDALPRAVVISAAGVPLAELASVANSMR